MGRRGTKPKPTKDKKIKGTYRKDRSIPDEVEFDALDKVPAAPAVLQSFAKNEWERVVTQLYSRGILNETDLSLVTAYCIEMQTYFDCKREISTDGFYEEIITEKGATYKIQHPCVAIGNKALANATRIATEFGFTPSSRTRISVGKSKDADPDKDALMKLMKKAS